MIRHIVSCNDTICNSYIDATCFPSIIGENVPKELYEKNAAFWL